MDIIQLLIIRIIINSYNNNYFYLINHFQIIHIDGGKAKKPKIPEFNHSTLPYEIIIQQNTIINNLGVFNLKLNINAKKCYQLINIENIPEFLNKFISKYYILIIYYNIYFNLYYIF